MAFESYASYYDALYEEKDYERECDFLERIFRECGTTPVRSVLDLGCGTGGHALPLAARGYEVVGVDRSEAMLAEARKKTATPGAPRPPEFLRGDIQQLEIGRRFDAVIAMFAVMSYQTTDDAFRAALRSARAHLETGGLLVFDAWFGPGVIADPPADRLKTTERDGQRILRFAHPTMDLVSQTVQVRYLVLRTRGDRVADEVRETHEMRFFFPKEVELLLHSTGFRLLRLCPFLDLDSVPSTSDWNFTAIAAAV